jgi:hypothetical protein
MCFQANVSELVCNQSLNPLQVVISWSNIFIMHRMLNMSLLASVMEKYNK